VSTEFFHFLLCTLMMQAPQLWMGVVPLALTSLQPTLVELGRRFPGHPLWQRYGARAQALVQQGQVGAGAGWCWTRQGCLRGVLSWRLALRLQF